MFKISLDPHPEFEVVVAPESYPTLEGKPHSILPHKIQVQDCFIAWHIVLSIECKP